jgi:hypothetical protein
VRIFERYGVFEKMAKRQGGLVKLSFFFLKGGSSTLFFFFFFFFFLKGWIRYS